MVFGSQNRYTYGVLGRESTVYSDARERTDDCGLARQAAASATSQETECFKERVTGTTTE